jgi:hypothetical protein
MCIRIKGKWTCCLLQVSCTAKKTYLVGLSNTWPRNHELLRLRASFHTQGTVAARWFHLAWICWGICASLHAPVPWWQLVLGPSLHGYWGMTLSQKSGLPTLLQTKKQEGVDVIVSI